MRNFHFLAALMLVSVALVGCGGNDDHVTPTAMTGAATVRATTVPSSAGTPAASPTAAAGQILFSGQLVGTTPETSTA